VKPGLREAERAACRVRLRTCIRLQLARPPSISSSLAACRVRLRKMTPESVDGYRLTLGKYTCQQPAGLDRGACVHRVGVRPCASPVHRMRAPGRCTVRRVGVLCGGWVGSRPAASEWRLGLAGTSFRAWSRACESSRWPGLGQGDCLPVPVATHLRVEQVEVVEVARHLPSILTKNIADSEVLM
jgi:hypothetical protein